MAKLQLAEKSLHRLIRPCPGPGGQKMLAIDLPGVRTLASKTGASPLEVEVYCLQHGVVPARYLRNIGTVGIEGQIKLLRSRIAVCGAGGLGGTVIELLARQGIGHLVIIDKGRFVENNLNRQIMATEGDLRKSKVRVAAERVRRINSAVAVTSVNKTINRQNAIECLKGVDVVIDALDSFATRRAVADACRRLKIPFVYGAIAGFYGQLMTIMPGDSGLDAVCDISSQASNCGVESLTGNPSATPAIIAAWEVQEAVKIITGIGVLVRHRLICLDFAEDTFDEIPLP